MGVPENIDALLVKFDINQDCLARIAGVAPSAVTRWRNGVMPREEPDVFDSADRCQVPAWVAEEHPRAFLLKVEGDCMDRVYPEGCLVAIDPDAEAVSGCVAAVQIDDTDFLMRRYIRTADTLVLSPDSFNPAHRDRVFTRDDWDDHFVRVVGRVVWFMGDGELR